MKTKITLVVDDEKVGPILRFIRPIGIDFLDMDPITPDKMLSGPAKPAAKKPNGKVANQNPKRGLKRGALRAMLLEHMTHHGDEVSVRGLVREGGMTTKQAYNTVSSMAKEGKLVRVSKGLYRRAA